MDKYKGYLKRQEYELSSTILWSTNGYQYSTLCTILGKGRLSENFTLIKKKQWRRENCGRKRMNVRTTCNSPFLKDKSMVNWKECGIWSVGHTTRLTGTLSKWCIGTSKQREITLILHNEIVTQRRRKFTPPKVNPKILPWVDVSSDVYMTISKSITVSYTKS